MSDKVEDEPKHDQNKSPVSARRAKKLLYLSEFLSKQESRINCKKVSKILKKSAHEHTEDEKATLAKHQDIVKRISKNKEKRELNQQRVLETEDGEDVLQTKCEKLAKIIQQSKKTVIYTGAGISTAASIPDYRGPQGVWTLLQKGEQLKPQDLSDAEPTLTHMCITQLHRHGHVKHVVSQNCDGLHLRSGLPRQVLSEVHGNMFIEICHNCRPHREYIRLFDVTENTGVRRHITGRQCLKCGGNLKDTIVHFGEKGGMKSPYRWKEAVRAANKCDLILCLGSSLKILKKYACLWCMDRVKHKRPKLAIVNLQWTPKDESATLKINGRCDDVLERVLKILGYDIPVYSRKEDPIFSLATCLDESEAETTNKKVLQMPDITPRLRSHGISRTPTPSDSSDSQSSLALSSSDSCDIPEDLTGSETNKHTSIRNFNFTNSHLKHDRSSDSKGGVLDSKEMCFSKSERICNEAKIAMQEKLVNAKLYEMYGTCSYMPCENLMNKTIGMNGLIKKGHVKIDGTVDQQPQIQYDPLRGGPFDPGPVSHEEKLRYLQTLQSQLEELKMKQKILREQEQQHLKKQRHQQLRQDSVRQFSHSGKQSSSKQVVKDGKHENIYISQVNTGVKQENIQELKDIQDQDKNKAVKLESKVTSLSNVKVFENDQIKPTKMWKFHHYSAEVRSSHPRSLLSKDIKTPEKLSSDTEISKNPQVVALEENLQQNLMDQKKLKNTLATMLSEQHKLEEQVTLQHQNEQLRLHQHFIIQEQLRQLAQESKTKKEEILNLFLFQQQSLLSQQNLKLQCVRQNYVTEVQKVQNVLDKLQVSYAETGKKLETLKTELRNKHMKTVMKTSIATPTAVNSNFPLEIEVKHQNVMVSPKPKSPRKDHSIASILEIDDESTSAHTRSVTLETAEIDKTNICDSCKFLNNYGMTKKWCSKCDEIKFDKESNTSQQVLAKCENRVESTFLEKSVASCVSNDFGQDSQTLENPVEQDYPIYNYVLDLEIPDVDEPDYNEVNTVSDKIEHNDHNYLNSKNDLDSIAKNNIKRNKQNDNEKLESVSQGHTVSISLTTSHANDTVSSCNPNLMSPIILYASSNMAESISDVSSKLNETNTDIESDSAKTNSSIECNSSNKIPERVTFNLNDDIKGEIDNSDREVIKEDAEGKLKPVSAVKHIRSHSQSEIYDHKQKVDKNLEPPSMRHIRCRSHSELNDVKNASYEDSLADTEADADDSNDFADSATKNKEELEDSVKTGKKRKLARCYSVPGWFGKGLNIKKRRRY